MADSKRKVLAVDDEPNNLQLLGQILQDQYQLSFATDGAKALEVARKVKPDIILLDIMMPGMDGYEVCRRLKDSSITVDIPVIFVTTKGEIEDESRGFEVGCVDYITKPVSPPIVQARVKTHVTLKLAREQILENFEQLKELETLRDNLTHMIVHDLRSPLTGMIGYLELLEMRSEGKHSENEKKYLRGAVETSKSLHEMISSLLDVSRLESEEMPLNKTESDLGSLVEGALGMLGGLVERANVIYEQPEESILVSCDQDLIRRVIYNIVSNSIKFIPRDGEVRITLGGDEAKARVSITDNGPGIPPEFHEKIFEKFGQVEAREKRQKYSTGLGLTFCKLAVEAHGGVIGVESELGRGSTFWFELPA